jgi:hypothetical protein
MRLGEGLRETVGQRLDQDLRVVVIGAREALGDRHFARCLQSTTKPPT